MLQNVVDPSSKDRSQTSAPACERCHRFKERCHNVSDQASCVTCNRLRIPCHRRVRKRLGRRSIIKNFSSGSCSVIDLLDESQPEPSTHSIAASGSEPKSVQKRPHHVLSSKEAFWASHKHFIIGPSFIDRFYQTSLELYEHCPGPLSTAYTAILELMATQNKPTANIASSSNLILGSSCLRSLSHRSSRISSIKDAGVVLMLGQILVAYNALMPLGSSTRTITRSTLLAVKHHWFSALHLEPRFHDITVTPVIVDTIDCLIRREIPVIRIHHTTGLVERFSGLCCQLLPVWYEICEISHAAKTTASSPTTTTTTTTTENPYLKLSSTLSTWALTLPEAFTTSLSTLEQHILLTHATLYRTATQLLLHRLQHPFGTADAHAEDLATLILTDIRAIEIALADSCPHPLSPCPSPDAYPSPDVAHRASPPLDFPLLLAMLERPASGIRACKALEYLRYRRRQGADMCDFAERVRQRREEGWTGLWTELVGEFQGDILP